MFAKVSVLCFSATYALTLALEVSRLYFGVSRKFVVATLFLAVAGILAHTIFLIEQGRAGILDRRAPLSNWYHWCLIAAWAIAIVYASLAFRRPRTAVGLFLLPLVLLLIGLATQFPPTEILPTQKASQVWGTVHGSILLLGTVVVMVGFAAGVMYLLQSYRLKHKRPPTRGLRLPTLEWLQTTSEASLVISSFLLGAGVLSGVGLNLARSGGDALPWSDPAVWTSGVLFLWLTTASLFFMFYKPARVGRKVAYLTMASFVFLALVLVMILFGPSSHGRPAVSPSTLPPQAGVA